MYRKIRRISLFFVLTFLCGSALAQTLSLRDSIQQRVEYFERSGDTLSVTYLETLFERARILSIDKA